MTLCKDCEFPDLCSGFRGHRDHIDSKGRYRRIIGCDLEKFIFAENGKPQEEQK